jgi:hypothetical protein
MRPDVPEMTPGKREKLAGPQMEIGKSAEEANMDDFPSLVVSDGDECQASLPLRARKTQRTAECINSRGRSQGAARRKSRVTSSAHLPWPCRSSGLPISAA